MKPKVLVLKTDGLNRDEETAFAFELAGAEAKIVHINDLRSKQDSLDNYQVVAMPGGFSYGDDIASAKILAVELTSFFSAELKKFIDRKNTIIIGICNGFQALVRTGLLPFRNIGEMNATLTNNDSGHFECRWIRVKVNNKNTSEILKGMDGEIIWLPVAHGEGKFFTDSKTLQEIEDKNLVAFRYVDEQGNPTQNYPDNPNGALNAIVGITDTTGRILGLMPHPEAFVRVEQHPNWRRPDFAKASSGKGRGLSLFENIVEFVKKA